MQYELSEQEVRHMEKYRALNAASQGATELFMERVAHVQAEIEQAEAEREAKKKSK